MNILEAIKQLEFVAHKLELGLLDVIGTMQAWEDLKKILAPARQLRPAPRTLTA